MADNVTLDVSNRSEFGTSSVRRLRGKDIVPGVIYGSKQDTLNIAVEGRVLKHAVQNEAFMSSIIDLNLDGSSQQVVVRDLQRHPASDNIIHVDFLRIDQDQEITLSIPLRFVNEDDCVGVRLGGGSITHHLVEVEVSCLPRNLPENIEVDLKELDIGDSVHLTSLPLPEGVTISALAHGDSHDRDLPVASVILQREELPEEDEDAIDMEVEGDVVDVADSETDESASVEE